MRILTIILACLLLCLTPVWAYGAECVEDFCRDNVGLLARMSPAVLGASSGAAAYTCCPDATNADLLCEDFDGSSDCGNEAAGDSNCQEAWSVSGEGGGNAIDFTTTHSGTLTSNYKGSYAVTLTDGDAGADGPRAYIQLGTNVSSNYAQLYFNVIPDLDSNSQFVYLAGANNATSWGTSAWVLSWYRVGSTGCSGSPGYKIILSHNNGSGTITDESSVTTLCKNTWYGVRVAYNYNTEGIAWSIDYDLDGTFTDQSSSDPTTTTRYASYFWILVNGSAVTMTPTVQFDMIKVDASEYPAATAP